MPITVNEGGVLHTLNAVTTNEGGIIRELSTVHANEGGVLREIFSAFKAPTTLEWTGKTSWGAPISYTGLSISIYVEYNAKFQAPFTLSGDTNITISYRIGNDSSCRHNFEIWTGKDSSGKQVFYKLSLHTGSGSVSTTLPAGEYYLVTWGGAAHYGYDDYYPYTGSISVEFSKA